MKKHNLKKAAAGVMVMVLGLSLAGCGNATNSNSDTQQSTTATQETAATVAAQPTTAEVTTEAPTKEINLERSMLTRSELVLVEIGNEYGLSEFISNFGVRLIRKGETVDLRDYCDWNSLSEEQKSAAATGVCHTIGGEMTMEKLREAPVFTNKLIDAGICFEYNSNGEFWEYYEYFN